MKLPPPGTLSAWLATHRWAAPLLLGILALAPYANSLTLDFVWDDRALILESPYVRDVRHLGEGLVSDYWKNPDYPGSTRFFYRPLMTLSFFIDYSLWGENPVGFHATNLLLHLINVLLVYSCFSALASRELALVSAALFAVHPIHTESVTWISGRTDLLASAFVLGAFRSYLSLTHRSHALLRLWALGLLYALALLTKEVAIVLVVAVAVHLMWFSSPADPSRRRYKTALWILVGIALLYSIFRLYVLDMPFLTPAARPLSLLIFNLPRLLARYLLKLVFPLRLYAHDPLEWAGMDQWPQVLLASLVLLAAAAGVWALGKRDRSTLFAAAWLGIFILPVLNAGTFTDVLVAERFLYLPSVGFCWLLAAGYGLALQIEGWRRPCTAALVALVLMGGVRTWMRNPIWSNEIVLFEEIHRGSPNYFLPHRALASAYLRHGMPEAAIQELEHVLARSPGNCGALNDLALAHYDVGIQQKSPQHLDLGFNLAQQAVMGCPESDVLHHTLGEYYLRLKNMEGNVDRALAEFQKAIAINPRAQYYYSIGSMLVGLERKDEARPYLAEYVRLAPDGENRERALAWLNE
jgi:tetratricopeptide (TPR) repeat protein